MNLMDCDQLAIDNDWSLARSNACHLSVQNDEMGVLAEEMILVNSKIDNNHFETQTSIAQLVQMQSIQMALWALVGAAIVGPLISRYIKNLYGNKNKPG